MGCAATKDDHKTKKTAPAIDRKVTINTEGEKRESVVKKASEAGRFSYMKDFVPDPRCPLTERQLYTVTKSWKAINRDILNTAINMFVRLFEQHDDFKDYFKEKFDAHQHISELRGNQQFESHAMVVICTIDEVISNLDDIDYILNLVDSISGAHVHIFGNRKPETFWEIEAPFLESVKEVLGSRYTVSLEQAYQITIRFVLTALTEDLRKKCATQKSDDTKSKSEVQQEHGHTSQQELVIEDINDVN